MKTTVLLQTLCLSYPMITVTSMVIPTSDTATSADILKTDILSERARSAYGGRRTRQRQHANIFNIESLELCSFIKRMVRSSDMHFSQYQ